eukprot:scaffold39549_cov160-Amphora_coffeaeformis.AAC.2
MKATERKESDFMERNGSLTPTSRAYADITAPSLPFVAEPTYDYMRNSAETIENNPSSSNRFDNLTPKSRPYSDITAPSLPFSDKSTYDRMYTSCTTTTTTTTTRPLAGNSLKAHMAKLSSKGPVVPSPAGSPWNNW